MNAPKKQMAQVILTLGLMAGLAGCSLFQKNSGSAPSSDEKQVGGLKSLQSAPMSPQFGAHADTLTVGSLYLAVNGSQGNDNSYSCFPTSQGWDRCFMILTNFIGASVKPDVVSYTNSAGLPSFTVSTCDPFNSGIQTGILTYELLHPGTSQMCSTNAGAACVFGDTLSIQQRTMTATKKYRALVFYKSSTLGTNTAIRFTFQYP